VYLCVLPKGATACHGGVQQTDSLDASGADGLHVLIVNGVPTLIWHIVTVASQTNPHADQIVAATVSPAGVLGAGTEVATAPSNSSLLDAKVAPNGAIWTISWSYALGNKLELREGLVNPPVLVSTPVSAIYAHVAWDHGDAILAMTQNGIDVPVLFSASSGSSFPAFKNVPHTGSIGIDIDLVNAGGHVRLISGRGGEADYQPVVTTWNGHSFPPAQHTGYPAKPTGGYPTSHDGTTDGSGRLVDISQESTGGIVSIGNLADDRHAAYVSFHGGSTFSGSAAQVSTGARGTGWAMWTVLDSLSGGSGSKLQIVPFRIAGLQQTVRKNTKHGSVTLTGPASCLPAVAIDIHAKGHGGHGWKSGKSTLKLDGKSVHSPLNGASLAAGKTYPLTGTVVFTKKSNHHKHEKVTAKLKFRSCPNT
jgi:hypothetical protein